MKKKYNFPDDYITEYKNHPIYDDGFYFIDETWNDRENGPFDTHQEAVDALQSYVEQL